MKIEKGKIVAATEYEIFSLYLKREMDAIMPFNEYKERMKAAGCRIEADAFADACDGALKKEE